MRSPTHDALYVDGRRAATRQDVALPQVREITALDRPTACVQCGGPAAPGARLVGHPGIGITQAWRQCDECADAPVDLARDIYTELGVMDDEHPMWSYPHAVAGAVREWPPPTYAAAASTAAPADPPASRWASPQVRRWTTTFPQVVRRYVR